MDNSSVPESQAHSLDLASKERMGTVNVRQKASKYKYCQENNLINRKSNPAYHQQSYEQCKTHMSNKHHSISISSI
jgi:hypothetical protein